MYGSRVLRLLALSSLLALAACAGKPQHINDVCAVFAENDGWVGNWRSATARAEREYGVPAHVLMATIRMESGFDGRARPPRQKILGFIPGKRASSAYGYSQALDGTWSQYRAETGRFAARRGSFADAVDFVGWYHGNSVRTLGISPHDAYSLYLAYYSGHAGYRNGTWRGDASIQDYARRTAAMAERYGAQMQSCRR